MTRSCVKRRNVVSILLCTALFVCSISCSKHKNSTSSAKFLLQQALDENNLPSLSVAVSQNDSIILAEALGFADIENQLEATEKSVYRVGSISKSLTATLIMILKEQKKLDIKAPINDYCQSFPEKGYEISSEQLLSHLGGIRHYDFDNIETEYYSIKRYSSSAEALDIFKGDSLVAPPGSNYHYSSYGYSILGCIIENLDRTSFQKSLKKNVFLSADMFQSTVDMPEQIIPNRTRPYETLEDGTWENSRPVDLSNKYPGGGVLSTPTDLVKFGNTLLQNQLISEESRLDMWNPRETSDGTPTNYALGWRVSEDRKEIYHGGSSAGGTAYLYIKPKEKLVIAFCSNGAWSTSRHKFVQDLAALYDNKSNKQ
ncbi:serine hydrolase domain-containing protein [Flagellimonas meridianipacifica]|uniref:CubicO group peptidase (Beta-lactamase class C family) n=1 Tax=Flagellimonas meridianipacifica TaxID=1080225 RepID=A0A2T0MBR4_9FLAO|nr:serine hydrolase domain-containing protein [Allomuricauda pacifica]PRX54944.1 CubicO group peptidase (beta-lactamase class C family) [Allomuricauda pacifica]